MIVFRDDRLAKACIFNDPLEGIFVILNSTGQSVLIENVVGSNEDQNYYQSDAHSLPKYW